MPAQNAPLLQMPVLFFCFVALTRERPTNTSFTDIMKSQTFFMTKAISNFVRFADGLLESKSHTIISNMTGNTAFPTPVPPIAALQAAADAFSEALVKANSGSRIDIADKNVKRTSLTEMMTQLCLYVNLTANGDPLLLLTTGFDLSKEPEPVVLAKPKNLRLENGVSTGELKVTVDAVKGAVAYIHEYTTDETLAPDSWVSTPSSTCKILYNNLLPGTKYYCRVAAVGSKGQIMYSDVLWKMAL